MVKVYLNYYNGRYTLLESKNDGDHAFFVPKSFWRTYQSHQDADEVWQTIFVQYDNKMLSKFEFV